MSPDPELIARLQQVLPDAALKLTAIEGTGLKLWLLDPQTVEEFAPTDGLMEGPPYWSIAWPTGLAMAQLLEQQPQWVRGHRVLDFGSGSGVVALAAARAGADQVIACDRDATAGLACLSNAAANALALQFSMAVTDEQSWDVLIVTDVLYDMLNVSEVHALVARSSLALVGDCRYRGAPGPGFEPLIRLQGATVPDFGDQQFESVQIYVKQGYTIQPNQ